MFIEVTTIYNDGEEEFDLQIKRSINIFSISEFLPIVDSPDCHSNPNHSPDKLGNKTEIEFNSKNWIHCKESYEEVKKMINKEKKKAKTKMDRFELMDL